MANRSTAAPRPSWAEVRGRRLDRRALSTPAHNARLANVVGAIRGAHAPVLSAAELSKMALGGVAAADLVPTGRWAGQRRRCRGVQGVEEQRQVTVAQLTGALLVAGADGR